MKKLIILIICTFFFTACAKEQASIDIPIEQKGLEIICNPLFAYPLQSSNKNGMYETSDRGDGSYSLSYLDFETKQNLYLCSQPNCAHDNENCTAYLMTGGSEVYPMATDNELLLQYIGNENEFNKTKNKIYLPHIEMLTSQGTEKKTIVEFSPEEFIFGAYAYNGEVLCYLSTISNQDDFTVYDEQSVYCTNVTTGKTTRLVKAGPNEKILIYGALNDELIIKKTITPDIKTLQGEDIYQQMYELTEFELIRFNVYTKEEQLIMKYGADEYIDIIWDNYWFGLKTLDNGEQSLEKMDLLNNKRTTILPKMPSSDSEYFLSRIIDNQLLINGSPKRGISREEFRFAVDINNGKTKNISTKALANGTIRPLNIVAQSKDSLVVEVGTKEINVKTKGQDGTLTNYKKLVAERAFVSKHDYLNSSENYTFVNYLE